MGRRSLLAAALALLSCGGGDAGAPAAERQGSAVVDSSRGSETFVTTSVRIEAGSEALLFGSGRITGVFVEEGDHVSPGQILIGLSGDLLVENAVASGAGELQAAGAVALNSERTFERCSELFEVGALSAMELEGAETAMLAARASLREARAGYEGALSGRSASTVQAPFSGFVGRVWAQEGNLAAGEPLLMITGGEGYIARALLPEREFGRIREGNAAVFESSTLPGIRFEGIVTGVSSTIDPVSCLLPVTVRISDADSLLAPGLYGSLTIQSIPGFTSF